MRNPPTRRIGEHVHDYPSALRFLRGKQERKLANNTLLYLADDESIGVRLHRTTVVRYFPDGRIMLDSGGWRTVTTKQRINELLPPGLGVSQERHEWYLIGGGSKTPFTDGMIVDTGRERHASNPESFGTYMGSWGDELELYGWIVTRDHLDNKNVTVMGPRNIPKEAVAMLKAGKGRAFKMYDDDGELYYSGRYVGPDDESLLGPLDDYGAPNAGCTVIKYRTPEGKWEEP